VKKRQKKKNEKKSLTVLKDESYLLTLTGSEINQAIEEYQKYRRHYGITRQLQKLNKLKIVRFYIPTARTLSTRYY